LPDLQRCYQRALRQDPSLAAAKVTLSIAVGVSGRVTNVAFDPPLPARTLESCVEEAVARWAFPSSPVDYETRVPLVLTGRN
jgi:outer membrane biosynthesis protein TonB